MAKAQFTVKQKVWVGSVGAWATVERITPIWAKGFNEPVKITYDVGLGREFTAAELRAEESADNAPDLSNWRLLRARNKWQPLEDCAHHPEPGTYPVIVTDAQNWGGWRTPGAEYDRDPMKIERQALLIAEAPRLMAIAKELLDLVSESPDDAPPELRQLAQRCAAVLRTVQSTPQPATAEMFELKAVSA